MSESSARQGPRYALVIRLPREHEVRIEDAYLGLSGLTKPVISYHITLLGPFRLRREPAEAVASILDAACQRWEPFQVRVHRVGFFERPDDHVAYLDVATPERVIALRDFLLKQLLPLVLPENDRVAQFTLAHYHPHVTLGLDLSDVQRREILAATDKHPLDLSFLVDCVWLVSQFGASPWRYERSFALSGDAQLPCAPDAE
ncbi:MAG: 2'-5' RNA ligase family protein [Anaerolineae bacterium]